MFFFAPDDGSAGTGATASDENGTGATGATTTTPFDRLDFNEFDEETRKELETARAAYVATLQENAKTKVELAHVTGLSKRFQSEADRLKAEQNKSKKDDEKEDAYLEIAKAELKAANYPPEDITRLAPVLANINRRSADATRKQLGHDLSPLAGTVMATEATTAFASAQQNDRIGFMSIPAVAQKVWELVQERTTQGQVTNEAIVANLGKMVYVDHMAEEASAGRTVTLPKNETAPVMSTRPNGFNYPGAGAAFTPAVPRTVDPKAARTTLNEDTQAALATTFAHMGRESGGIKPTAFGGKRKTS
jgi:hypothetical protein